MRTSIFFILFIALGLTANANAQPDSLWSRTYGGMSEHDRCNKIIYTSDSCFVLCGFIYNENSEDVVLSIKVDADGQELWNVRSGEEGLWRVCESIIQADDGGYALCGRKVSVDGFWAKKIDSEGNVEWEVDYSEIAYWGQRVIQTSDGGYLLAGQSIPNNYPVIFKLDEDGNEIWSHEFSGFDLLSLYDILEIGENNFIISGDTHDSNSVFKTNRDGDIIWTNTFESGDHRIPLILNENSNIVIAGSAEIDTAFGYDIWLRILTGDGEIIRTNFYQGEENEYCTSLQLAEDGLIISGYTNSNNDYGDYFMLKTDENGDSLWSCTFDRANYDVCNSITLDDMGNYFLAGTSNSYPDPISVWWLMKAGTNHGVAPSNKDRKLPNHCVLLPAYPNPFNSQVMLEFTTKQQGLIDLSVFDLTGQRVALLLNEYAPNGSQRILWNAANFPAGEYIIKMSMNNEFLTIPVVLVK